MSLSLSRASLVSLGFACLALSVACTSHSSEEGDDDPIDGTELCADDIARPDSWTADSHCKGTEPHYELLFDDAVVHRIDITVSADNYQATLDNLDDLLGGGGGGGPGGMQVTEDPMWVPVTVAFNGHTWTQVGMRYKGNSSLNSAYRSGVNKYAFRLTFDKYEEENPDLEDQRFYGFKKMTFSNGFNDPSLMRDKLAADLMRAAGVPAARTAFSRIYVDHGEGPVYFGLYTMVEDPSNKMIDTQFEDGSGNLYKPESMLSSFNQNDFEKKTNEDEADWTDVQGFVAAINADRSDASTWRANLEAVFDVTRFLRYLALNQAMMNWDTYGWMAHNYYLYADPSDNGRIVWIPWDMNEALLDRGSQGPGAGADSVLLAEITTQWPLIRYVLDDPTYAAAYRAELVSVQDGAFAEATVHAKAQAYHDLIAPYATGADGETAPYTFLRNATEFSESVTGGSGINPHVTSRHNAITAALQ